MQKCMTKCCSQLKVKLVKQAALQERKNRKKNLLEYIPNGMYYAIDYQKPTCDPVPNSCIVTKALGTVLSSMSDASRKRKRTDTDEV